MTGNMPRGMQLLEVIPAGWSVVHLQLPVAVPDLGTWYAPACVRNPEGQVAWRLLRVQVLGPSSIELKLENG